MAFGDSDSEDEQSTVTPEEEAKRIVQAYKIQAPIPKMEDPFEWWKQHAAAFGPLAQLAENYL